MTIDKGILIRNIYYMLAYAFQELRMYEYVQIKGESFRYIHDLFTEIMIRAISYQLKQGLHREYVSHNESMSTLRGKIDINGTIKHKIAHSNRLSCDYDILTEDNIFNQIIVTTAHKLLRCEDVDKNRKAQLKRLMLFFSNVKQIDIKNIQWTTILYNRNNSSYQMLHYLSRFIIDGLLMTTEEGNYKMREFSDEHMNRLFEKFVLEYYKRHYPKLDARADQVKWNLDKEFSKDSESSILPRMQTDIMLKLDGRTLIIDTKYYGHSMQSQYDKSTIHSANLYQIHTYVTEKDEKGDGKVDGMLLYAKTQEENIPNGQIKLANGNIILFRTLDLNQNFEDIKKSLDNLLDYNK